MLKYGALALVFLAAGCGGPVKPVNGFQPLHLPELDLTVLPESERSLRRIVLGLDVNTTKQYMVPSTMEFDRASADPKVRFLRRRLYWLTFEILHGQIFRYAPPHSRFFISVPDPKLNPQSLGNEEEVVREYLAERMGWSKAQIAARVNFFKIAGVNPFPQDAAEILGRDSQDRIVLGLGRDQEWSQYGDALKKLVAAFPKEFALRELDNVNTEGGDLELIWMPEGRPGLLVGNHRIRRWVTQLTGADMRGKAIPQEQIDQAKAAFSKAFFGLEVLVLGEDGLRNPLLISEELFHVDMVANILRNGDEAVAFVPSYAGLPKGPHDAITRQPLGPEVAARIQRVYDRAARQLARRGYRVTRLPFSDHPVRNPVNVAKFIHPVTGSHTVLLGKYPYHYALDGGGEAPQQLVQHALDDLHKRVEDWRLGPGEATWGEVTASLARIFAAMDKAAESPNPDFEAQLREYEKGGVRILPMPLYPSGEGGLHCLLLN